MTRQPAWWPSDRVPLAAIAIVGWIILEFVVRIGFGFGSVALLTSRVGGEQTAAVIGSFVGLLLGIPIVGWLLSWYALRAGQTRSMWEYAWDRRRLLAGAGVGILTYVLAIGGGHLSGLVVGQDQVTAQITGLREVFTTAPWVIVIMLLGNGVAVPIAEERVWRGIIQTDLVARLGAVGGISVTTIVFALKHVLIDGSLVRVGSLLVLGAGFGMIRHRWGTGASTIAHILTNLGATVALIGFVFDILPDFTV